MTVERVVLMVEDASMREFLDTFLPSFAPGLDFLCIPHEGKRDLEVSIPRKLRAWREPGVRFVVLRDNDGADCHETKKRLVELCRQAGRGDVVVRIACQEVEAWYLGDPPALAAAYGQKALGDLHTKARYRDPDAIGEPSGELRRLVPEFRKSDGARRVGATMSVTTTRNRSRSFHVFLEGLMRGTDGFSAKVAKR